MKIKFRVSTEANIKSEVESYSAGVVTFTERGIYLCVEGDGTSTNGTLVAYDGLSTENFLNKSTGNTASKPSTDLYDGKLYFDNETKKMYVALGGIWEELGGNQQTVDSGTKIEVVTTKPDNSEGENGDVKIDNVAKVLYCKVNNVWETIGISESQFNDLSTRVTNIEQELTISVNSLQEVIANRVNVKALYAPISISPDLVVLKDTNFETLIQGVTLGYDEALRAITFDSPIVASSTTNADSLCQHTLILKNGVTDYKGIMFQASCGLVSVVGVKNATKATAASIGGFGGNKKIITITHNTTPTTLEITGTNGSAQFEETTTIIAMWDNNNNLVLSAYNPTTQSCPVSVTNKFSNNQVLGICRGFGQSDLSNLYTPYTNNIGAVKIAGIKASSTTFDVNTALKDLVAEYNKLWI